MPILDLLDGDMIKDPMNDESEAFYQEVKARYHCYIAEINGGDNTCDTAKNAVPIGEEALEAVSDEVNNLASKRDVWICG